MGMQIKKPSESKIPRFFLEVSFHDTKGMSNHKVITKFIAQEIMSQLCDKKASELSVQSYSNGAGTEIFKP